MDRSVKSMMANSVDIRVRHLFGEHWRHPKAKIGKRQFRTCRKCGRPCRTAICHKCEVSIATEGA